MIISTFKNRKRSCEFKNGVEYRNHRNQSLHGNIDLN